MKRLFLILCLMTICKISYADIASVGYVDSVAATKQDTITDIATIRSGAAAGATAVQPSSLSTVATSGSYNDLSNKPTIPTVPTTISSFTNDSGYITNSYHDSTKQDKLPNVPGNNGKYKLVWNNNTGQLGWELEQFSLTCSSGTYDIGFSQCIDPATNGSEYGFMNDSTGDRGPNSSNTDTYGLTTDQTWGVTFSYGIVKGIASCNGTPGTYAQSTNQNFNQTDKGQYCWCKMTFPAVSRWVFYNDLGDAANCAGGCAYSCGGYVQNGSYFRTSVFSSVGQ
ncbi:MAG: hypothetical protein MJ170_01455 [Alphaproteobacteria bacterium]|nr:hypothetical protein [Alphaproteobacteria bacterium]